MPPLPQRYNDAFRGWPVRPHNRQHPVRGSFLDPRPDPRARRHLPHRRRHRRPRRPARARRAGGADAPGLRDRGRRRRAGDAARGLRQRPRRALRLRTRRRARLARRACDRRAADRLDLPRLVAPAPERVVLPGRRQPHPRQPAAAGREAEAVRATRPPPVIDEVRFYTPARAALAAPARGERRARLPPAGRRLDKTRLSGIVDVRARVQRPAVVHRLVPRACRRSPPRITPTGSGSLLVERRSGRVVLPAHRLHLADRAARSPPASTTRPGRSRTSPRKVCLRGRGGALRRRLLVPTLPAPLLEHDPAPQRPLPPRRPTRGTPPATAPARTSRSGSTTHAL